MAKIFREFTPEKLEQVRTHPYYEKARKTIIERADHYAVTDPPVMKFSKIHLYVECGNREIFERDHVEYETRMLTLFLAYLITEDEKYLSPLADIMWSICDFESWSIPAHVSEELSIEERRRNLDLCSCILGYRLSEIVYLIGDKLPALVVKRVKAEVRYRVIESFRDCAGEKRYSWLTGTNNWAAVCIAGVLCSYLYLATDEEIKEQLPRMMTIADNYLRGFEDDGCCTEGYAYWNYGFSFFCVFAKMLLDYTDGEINYFENKKVRKIAMFQQNILLNETQCLSFSDGGLDFEPYIWLSHFLKRIYPEMRLPALPRECVIDYSTAPLKQGAPIRYLLWTDPDLKTKGMTPKSHIFKNAEWFLHHGEGYSLGAKAGHNEEFHNHNDVGSFLFSKGGRVTFCDPGGGEYTADYFGENRYSIFVTSGRAHSVPVINGKYQSFGKREGGVIIAEKDRFKFSMKGGYEIDTLDSLVRDFECLEDGIRLTDTFEFSECPASVAERFVSLLPIEQGDGCLICGDATLTYDKELFDTSFGSEIVSRKGGVKETVYYVDLTVKRPEKCFELIFEIK